MEEQEIKALTRLLELRELPQIPVRVLLLETLAKRQTEYIAQLVASTTGHPVEKIKLELYTEVAQRVRRDLGIGIPPKLPPGAEPTIEKWLHYMLH